MQIPEPSVLLHNLTSGSVDFRILFWAADISTWVGLKSQILADIYEVLTKEGIQLPQQDVHLIWPQETLVISTPTKEKTTKETTSTDTDAVKSNQPDQDQ